MAALKLIISDKWAQVLEPGESLLWHGRPTPRLRNEFRSASEPLVALFFLGFGASMLVRPEGAKFISQALGLCLVWVGLFGLVGVHFWRAYLRACKTYALTDRRALIEIRTWRGKTLRSYPIGPGSTIDMWFGMPGSIFFATEEVQDPEGGVRHEKIGFELIEDFRAVQAIIRELQRAPASSSTTPA